MKRINKQTQENQKIEVHGYNHLAISERKERKKDKRKKRKEKTMVRSLIEQKCTVSSKKKKKPKKIMYNKRIHT